jgi:ABC-type dipeptide/oligopeptide/nickel transport system permease component
VRALVPLGIDLVLEPLVILGFVSASSWMNALSTPGFWMALMLVYILAYLIGLIGLFPLATMAAQKLNGGKALWIGLIGALVYQGVYFIFIR